ncbi:T9SS type A sorting domain-containing protein, partial [bacterium]|nr:T9SS type A sorting domain-containing protein [bacterium]
PGFTPTDVVETELMAGDRLDIYPSPLARGLQATIRASRSPGAESGKLLVFDAQGRTVRLIQARVAGNEVTAQWDGRTGHGERAAAGVYFIQWRDARGSASGKLVLLD